MKKLFTFILFLGISFVTFGAYLENIPTSLVQPNGEVLHLFITGDEFYSRVHDSEGYSVVPGEDGWYYYAMYDAVKDELVPSEYRVTASRNFALNMDKELTISHNKYMEKRYAYYEPTGCDPSGASKKSILKDLANNGVKTTQQMNNIVICIGFADTQDMTHPFSYVDGMFNSNSGNNMRDFFSTMSYNKLDLLSHFYPQPDGNLLRFYRDEHPRGYFQPYSASNPIGYNPNDDWERADREQTLLANAIDWVNDNDPVPLEIDLDVNNDGLCDFISFVVQGNVGEWAVLLWPHKWSLFMHDVFINGKQVWEYNFELDGNSTYFSNNVFCHEGYHVLGAPDLYHYYNYTDRKAVGSWDIMDYSYLAKPQSMSAYMKFKYGNWTTSLPTAAINKTYELFPFYFNDGSDPEKPVMYKIPMTETAQFSVVEYRKKTGTNYDNYLPNQGFLIYRINPYFNGNAGFDGSNEFDEVYLYRNGSSQTSGVYSQGSLDQAPYNPSNKKTEFNSTTNPKPCQSNGTPEVNLNINNIQYDSETDTYTFFYGDPTDRNLAVSVTELVLDMDSGATGTVAITSNVLWRVTIPENAQNWLTVSSTKGLSDETLTFTTLSSNTSKGTRVADVTIACNEKTFHIIVIQGIPEDVIVVTVTPNPIEGGTVSGGGTYAIGDMITLSATAKKGYIFMNWMEDGVIISTQTNYELEGTKSMVLVANFEKEVGIYNNKQEDNFTVFPNPAKNELRVTSYGLQDGVIEIYDVYGRIVLPHHIITSSSHHLINITHLSSGVYFIKMVAEQSSIVKKFIVVK